MWKYIDIFPYMRYNTIEVKKSMEIQTISERNWIEKSNVLNEMRTPLNLTEMRLLLVYQSKINARNKNSAKVTFSLKSFQKIMNINCIDVSSLKGTMKKISQRIIEIPYKNGFQFVPLYQRCGLYQKEDGNWYIDIECNEEMLPYMFEMKRDYFKYQLWNSVNLTSVNQIRMYEILKQYEKIGKRTIKLEVLKAMLGLDINRYSQYRDFKRYVLDVCQKALEKHTDIKFDYETIKGAKGKVLSIVFYITKNENFKDDLRLKEFINPKDLEDIIDVPNKSQNTDTLLNNAQSQNLGGNDKVMVLYYELDKAYSTDELKQLLDVCKGISSKPDVYLKNIYYQIRARKKKINNLFSYTLTVINADLKNSPPEEPKKKKSSSYDDTPSYDLDAYIKRLHHKYREEPFPNTQKYYFHSNEVTTFDIHTILKKNFDIYDDNLYDIRSLQGIIDYIYEKYNVLLIDVNPTGEYDKLAFGER